MDQTEILKSVQSDIKDLAQSVAVLINNGGKQEEKISSAHKRIDEFTRHIEAIIRMSVSIDNLTRELTAATAMNEKRFEQQNVRIDRLENRPLKFWDYLITALLALVVTYAFNAITKGA